MVPADEKLINETLRFWQSRTSSVLTKEDAHLIMDNISEWIEILEDWEDNGA